MINQYQAEQDVPILEIAAALAQLIQGDAPFLLQSKPHRVADKSWDREPRSRGDKGGDRGRDRKGGKERFKKEGAFSDRRSKAGATSKRRPSQDQRSDAGGPPGEGMERYRLAVGHDHGVMPGNIVGAIANEADISGKNIGRINIYDDYTLIDLPKGMPNDTFHALRKVWVAGQRLGISRMDEKEEQGEGYKPPVAKGKNKLSLPSGRSHKKRDDKPKRKPKNRRP